MSCRRPWYTACWAPGRQLFFLDPTALELKVAEFSTTADSFQRWRITTLFTAPEGTLSSVVAAGWRVYDVAQPSLPTYVRHGARKELE